MLYMLINRTRPTLRPEQYEELGRRARAFYDNVPAGVRLHGDWGAIDGSCTFALVEVDDDAQLERIQAPFRGYVDIETIPVRALSGWGKA